MAGLASNTLANPGNSFYAPAGESARNWYQFPSLNGSILLNDASGTQVLQAVQGDLFFNQELLAKAGDIQDIADWALYPALADVDMNGKNISDISGLTVNNEATMGSLLVTNGITSQSNIVTATLQTVGAAVPALGQITTSTLAASGQIQAGSVTSTGAISGTAVSGTSLATTGGLDMTNSGITRASSVGISAAGLAPYGALSSPDGVMLTWNGQTITTGGGGSAANWASFPALTNVNMNTNNITNAYSVISTTAEIANVGVGTVNSGKFMNLTDNSITGSTTDGVTLSSRSGQPLALSSGTTMNMTVGTSATVNTSNDFNVTCDGGLNPLITPAVNLTAQNGNGGQINLTADPGSIAAFGGVVNIIGNGGTINIPQPPPQLPISVTVGGEVNITANTGAGAGLYTATSAINLNAAAINSYAGAIPSIGSLLGYNTVFGNLGVSICAGLPPSGIQFPGTVYVYGLGIPGVAGGVRIESPTGIQLLSDTYCQTLYPLDGDDLTIQGRSLPTGYVRIKDVAQFEMTPSGRLKSDFITSLSGIGLYYEDTLKPSVGSPNPGIEAFTLKPPLASSASSPNLVISNNPLPLLGYNNFVEIANATTIAFDASGAGALSGVQSINGAAWPPPTGDASLWSQYPQTSVLDSSGFGIINLATINGQPVGDLTPAGWAAFNAIQNVDMSSNELLNVNDIHIIPNATIIGQGALNVDVSGDLQFFTSGGGEINFSTGNSADINITTLGSGNELSLAGDVVNIDGTLGVRIAAPYLDMTANNVINVNQLLGAGNGTDLVISNPGTGTVSILDQSGTITISSQFNGLVLAAGTNINMTSVSGSILQNAPVTIGQVGFPKNLTVNGNAYATTDVISSFGGATPYSLNTIGGLVAGTSSRFRDQTEFYVSNDGSDTSGNGSILAPYQTIQKAITQAELISSAALVCCINVASGHYNENLTFNKGYIILTGALQSQTGNEVTEITGSISIACVGANDVFNRQVTFQGFNITSAQFQSITDTSTASHTVTFQDCKCFMNSQFFVSTATCPDMRLYLTNVEISQTNVASSLPVILTNVGLVEMERVDITVDGNASAISVTGTSVLSRCSLTTLEITSTAATLAPLLNITSTSTATHSLGNVAFAYTSAVAKTATNAVYIASGIATAILMFNCLFTLTGTASSTNNCIGYNGVGSPTIAGINNASLNVNVLLPQTTSVQSGITQIQYTNIQPPGLASYSSTVDQSIAVAGTPQALTYNTTQFNQGTTLVANSRIYVTAQGNYALNYIVQLSNTAGASHVITTFLKKNGTTITNTGSAWTIDNAHELSVAKENIVSLNAGDYVEVFMNGTATGLLANATAAAGALPAIPSVVFNVKQFR